MIPDLEVIRSRRKAIGLTQKDLAKRTGISQSLIAKMETGKVNPSYRMVKRIFDTLDELEEESKRRSGIKNVYTKNVVFVEPEDSVVSAVSLMRKRDISQLPVIDARGRVVGSVSESELVDLLAKGEDFGSMVKKKVKDVMAEPFPLVTEDTPLEAIVELLHYHPAVLIGKHGDVVGIITKSDILNMMLKR